MAKITVRFLSLAGRLTVAKTEDFASVGLATMAVTAYAMAAGFTNVKLVHDDDMDGMRWTARTPKGRSGRNVAVSDGLVDETIPHAFKRSAAFSDVCDVCGESEAHEIHDGAVGGE